MNYRSNFYKLYLSCKRGMLELDIILLNFLEKEYFNMDKQQIILFEKFLSESDNDIYKWLILKKSCDNKEFIEIINYIKKIIF